MPTVFEERDSQRAALEICAKCHHTAAAKATEREQRIAHLSLHGWVPIYNRVTRRAGVHCAEIGIGFAVRRGPDPNVKMVNMENYAVCEWKQVTTWHLDRIDARLHES